MRNRISIFILLGLFLISCKLNKGIEARKSTLSMIIDNYIIDFTHFVDDGYVPSLLLYIDSKGNSINKIIIQDYPLEHLYNDIRNKEGNKDSIFYGKYKEYFIKLIANPNTIKSFTDLINYDSVLMNRASIPSTYVDNNGLIYTINEGLTEYEPYLESIYCITKGTKILELSNGQILQEKYKVKR